MPFPHPPSAFSVGTPCNLKNQRCRAFQLQYWQPLTRSERQNKVGCSSRILAFKAHYRSHNWLTISLHFRIQHPFLCLSFASAVEDAKDRASTNSSFVDRDKGEARCFACFTRAIRPAAISYQPCRQDFLKAREPSINTGRSTDVAPVLPS